MKISEIITDKYKLRIEPTVYYDLLADVREAEEKQEPCEDAVSKQGVAKILLKYVHNAEGKAFAEFLIGQINDLPSVNPQKPCKDAISRQAVLDATVKKNSIWNSITNSKGENLEEIISQLPPINSQKPCKDAFSREAVLDKIRAEIDEQYDRVHPYDISCAEGLEMALNIVNKFMAEGSKA